MIARLIDAPRRTVVIESVAPTVDCGRYAVKREVGAVFEVSADIFKDGHDLLVAYLKYRRAGERAWRETPMRHVDNDRWAGAFTLEVIGRYHYTIEALAEPFRSWLADLEKRHAGGQDLASALGEGLALIRAAAEREPAADRRALSAYADRIERAGTPAEAVALAGEVELGALMARHIDRSEATWAERELEVVVDRERARFAAWYEFFPRSGVAVDRSATFKEAEAQLGRAAAMGFDVVYLPPIHPIGRAHRKGRNNALVAAPGDPGSPWAIGSTDGGFTAVHPDLGTLDDFDRFVEAARRLGLEVALDFAIQCSPDHPWVHEHPEWFFHRPDGTIKYAENPPKKYQDIYPLNFQCQDARSLWEEMRRILEFWIGHGVHTFRVDNPHTKPVKFWEWVIRAVQDAHPEVIFLAEAFTRPKMMKALGKAGFSQSYTYFTWRNEKQELIDYLTEITAPPVAEYFRGNLWPNTPDILHETLQRGGRPAFKMRLALAATLSSLYGIYAGYELCENVAREPGSEEYLNSEKYEYKVRDWDAPGNLVGYVTRINRIRRENRALHLYRNLRFFGSDDPNVLFYAKMTPERDNLVFVAANLDPFATHAGLVDVPIAELGIGEHQAYRMHELITDRWFEWHGPRGYVELNPDAEPAQIFALHR
ncbi:MAG: alpha-1,4-glucan--maltose-1-phosphate maltosyltransferase [Candidatus Rokuibacteriota bacterium]|nr:MAG: alpha-1,4-glucan--maltose-1-phosphate maltosyltransferase [Candidatus Rokubacteria bacterium]